jgi:LPS-assembly lipoprotein
MLGGCGFHPLYAPSGPHDWDPALAAIVVDPIRDRQGQILEQALRESLNPGDITVAPRWRLRTLLTVTRVDLGIQRNATATTSEIIVSASYQLSNRNSQIPIYASSSQAVGDFDEIDDAYATQVAADSARDRALQQIADDMTLRLTLFVRSPRAKGAS